MNWMDREKAVLMHSYARFPIVIVRGQGSRLYDEDGKEYIDLTGGIGVNALGYGHEDLNAALKDQIDTIMQASNLYYTTPMIEAAEKLTQRTGLKNVFFANSGAEANEGAIKLARKYGRDRRKILTLENSFHGRTIAGLEATGQDKFHQEFYPFTGGFGYVKANDLKDLEEKLSDPSVCGLMMELVQGESGVRPLDPEFVKRAEELCREKDILLIIDEVQTGVGRTGELYCFQNYGIMPDLFTTAKALGGGVPIGAVVGGEKVQDVFQPGDHGSTFGGNPLAARAALTVLDTIDEAFLADVKRKGKLFQTLLREIASPLVKDVRGMGLMIGVEVPEEKIGMLIAKMQDKGILPLKAGKNTIRLLPPLVITEEEIREAAQVIKEVLEDETLA